MSNLREKAREIKAAGEAERGNFEPSGTPLRMYNYWLNNSSSSKAASIKLGTRRENFCHFWRVVAIWAGLTFLLKQVDKVVFTKSFGVVLGLAALFAVYVVLTNTGALVPALIFAGIALTVGAVGAGIVFLFKRYWNHDWDKRAADILFITFLAIMSLVMLGVLVGMVIDMGWIVLVYLAGGLVAAALAIFALASLSTFISGRRALDREKREAAEAAERERIAKMTNEEYFAYLNRKNTRREPGRISKFFSGLADFLILATQVVRVKKWKICPMVDIKQ